MKKSLLIAAFAAVFAISGISVAQTRTQSHPVKKVHTVSHRQKVQQKRIIHGVKSGQLTKRETRSLERQQARIQRTKRIDKKRNGGKLTPAEKRHLNRMQNRASRHIYRAKHNKKIRH